MDPKIIRAWGQIVVSFYALTIFAVMAFYVFWTRSTELMQIVVAAVMGYAAASFNFYLGDSSSSQTKDDVIASSAPPTHPTTPGQSPPRPTTPPITPSSDTTPSPSRPADIYEPASSRPAPSSSLSA